MSDAAMIEVRDVVYDYASARALFGVSATVRRGAVLALVGPNGAGKSTLMRCIAALDTPVAGTITVAGLDARADPRGVHAALGYLPDFFGLYDELSVRRALVYAARSRGVGPSAAPGAAEAAAARVGLSDRMEKRAGELSRGLRQRLAIAQTLVHSPQVLLLDEPAAGLDPEARRDLSDLIRRLAAEGMTIMVSSHILAELEDYCTEMLMLRGGRVVEDQAVTGGGAAGRMRVRVGFAAPPPDLAQRLAALGFEVARAEGDEALLILPASGESDALARLMGAGLAVRSFAPERERLEDAYLRAARQPAVPLTGGDEGLRP